MGQFVHVFSPLLDDCRLSLAFWAWSRMGND